MKALISPRLLAKAAGVLVLLALGIALVLQNATAREVALQAAANLFGFVTTPFILEATVALFGLIAVMTYNQWRLGKEGDGWVVLPEDREDGT